MRNFISELNGLIGVLQSKKLTIIPPEPPAGGDDGGSDEPVEDPIVTMKEYVNSKIDETIGKYNSTIAYFNTDAPWYHRTQPRYKTFNELYQDLEEVLDTFAIYSGNYKDNTLDAFASDIDDNTQFLHYELFEAEALDLTFFAELPEGSPPDYNPTVPVPTNAEVDAVFVDVNNEIDIFKADAQINGNKLHNIENENQAYFVRMKRLVALDSTAALKADGEDLGNSLYGARIPQSKATIDDLADKILTVNKVELNNYKTQLREDLKIER